MLQDKAEKMGEESGWKFEEREEKGREKEEEGKILEGEIF